MIGYADRTRVLSEDHRRKVFTINGIIKGTVLYDGFVVATWKASATRRSARLAIQPLQRLPRAARTDILAEGNNLLQFQAADSESREFEIATL
jgi:hypothetical protein